MKIIDFFDPYNFDHLQAYRHLEEHGQWPQGFLPDDIELDSGPWVISLIKKMALAWLIHNEECAGRLVRDTII
jgi:hypothetical protein